MYKVYQVLPNETIESIARKLNITSDELRRINGIGDNATLKSGSYIIIPNNNNSKYKTYIVKKGDNLYSIAKQNNIDYLTLVRLNGLKEEEYIYPEQEIIIPLERTYITKDNETINSLINNLNIPYENIKDLYLKEDQIITY